MAKRQGISNAAGVIRVTPPAANYPTNATKPAKAFRRATLHRFNPRPH